MHWRMIDSGSNDAAYNMALDETLLKQVAAGQSAPVIRFYRWNPAAVSAGYFQDLDKEIDLDGCKQRGIDIVRRLTGGRTVLHHYEVTYSVLAPEHDPRVSGSVLQSYLKLSTGLLKGLRLLGIPAEIAFHPKKTSTATSSACFASPSRYELVVEGKKLVGSAQTRQHGALLQHGSILLDLDVQELADTIKFAGSRHKQHFLRTFPSRACAINQVTAGSISADTVVEALTHGFEEALDITLREDTLTQAETHLLGRLIPAYKNPRQKHR